MMFGGADEVSDAISLRRCSGVGPEILLHIAASSSSPVSLSLSGLGKKSRTCFARNECS